MRGVTAAQLAEAVGGRLIGDGSGELRGLVIDSRRVEPGLAFAALPGERVDGHEYVARAFESGAPVCLVSRVPEGEERPLVLVDDVAEALADFAAWYRQRLCIPVVGVTGSVGKTTAKEMIASVLSQRYNTLRTEKNFNNELGVPLTLFRIDPEHEAAVIELGISHFGEMSRLAHMARPTIAVYTVIGQAHLEFLGDRRGVMAAKGELLTEMGEEALVCCNGDDDLLSALRCRQRKLCFGLSEHNDLRAVDIDGGEGESLRCRILGLGREIEVHIASFGRHLVYAALAAAAVGIELGLTDEEIAAGLSAYVPVGRRSSVLHTESLTIIDDCYNANPDSMASAIESAAAMGGRLVCILGDMLELGREEERLHRETGFFALSRGALLLTCGELSRHMGGRHFETKEQLIAALPTLLHPGDRVLVKASHSMAFEEISDALKTLTL